MKFINQYWKIITSIILVTLSVGALQAQVAQNKTDIKESHESALKALEYIDKQDAKIILVIQKENEAVKRKAEKDYEENKKDIEKLKLEQKNQTVLQVNQKFIMKGLESMQQSFKELANEIRRGK